jgi:hypothetical protein
MVARPDLQVNLMTNLMQLFIWFAAYFVFLSFHLVWLPLVWLFIWFGFTFGFVFSFGLATFGLVFNLFGCLKVFLHLLALTPASVNVVASYWNPLFQECI